MQIAVLSGKGGTGKTTVATNLAKLMGWQYVDCDVEEPNGYLFLKPEVNNTQEVDVPNPVVDKEKCIGCKKCVDICQFNALAYTNNGVMIFEKLCHGCGACSLICPAEAIKEEGRVIGKIDIGTSGNIKYMSGLLNISEPMAVPIIEKLKSLINDNDTIIDCSPGSSCTVVQSLKNVDFALLVTEPTEFGLHDLKIAVELVRKMGIPLGIIVNRADEYNNIIIKYCDEEKIKIIGVIPFDKKIAELYSKGNLLIEDEQYEEIFANVAREVREVITCN